MKKERYPLYDEIGNRMVLNKKGEADVKRIKEQLALQHVEIPKTPEQITADFKTAATIKVQKAKLQMQKKSQMKTSGLNTENELSKINETDHASNDESPYKSDQKERP